MNALDFLISFPSAQRALIAGLAVAVICSLLSVFVVLKRMAFIGQGVSHAGYGAAASAFFLGFLGTDLWHEVIVFAFCIATALTIGIVSRRRRIETDTAIGILLVAAMAWGLILTNLSAAFLNSKGPLHWPWYAQHIIAPGSQPNFDAVLYGALLNITPQQAAITLVLSALSGLVLLIHFKAIVFFTFDEPTSRVYGVPSKMIHQLLLVLLAIVIVLTMRVAGMLLVSAFLVIPGATGLLLSSRLSRVFAWSCATGVMGIVGGLFLCLELEFAAAGPCIVGVLCLLFGLAWTWRAVRR
jgi:ABC-type Mn2+/Zn2+ transport system permease subunit